MTWKIDHLPIALLVGVLLAHSNSTAGNLNYNAEEKWNRTGFAPYSLHNISKTWSPKSSIGLAYSNSEHVFICDELSQSLVGLSESGVDDFAAGSQGEGPSEHRGHGEVLFWNERALVRADCTTQPKIIEFDQNGIFIDSFKIEGIQALSRLFWNGQSGIAVGTEYSQDSNGGAEMSSYLYLMDRHGKVQKKSLLKTMKLVRGKKISESEAWIEPRISVSPTGHTFVQADLFSDKVTCFDEELQQIWTIEGGWKPRERSSSRLEYVYSFTGDRVVVSQVEHTIERMVARDDGTLWIRTFASTDNNDDNWLFEVFDENGNRTGTTKISGLPRSLGTVKFSEDSVIWLKEYDSESVTELPYLRVFRLVKN